MSEHDHSKHNQDYSKEYMKFGGVIFVITLISYYLYVAFGSGAFADFIRFFMGMFLVTFASFKFWNLEEFPEIFASYDIVAKRFSAYGYIYPFIQLVLGALYLADGGGATRDLIMIAISAISAYGVIQAVYINKKTLHCACLGNVIQLPLSTITLIEDAGMGVMALMVFIL